MSLKVIATTADKIWATDFYNVNKWGPKCYDAITGDANCMGATNVAACANGGVESCRRMYLAGAPNACATPAIEHACAPLVEYGELHAMPGYGSITNGPSPSCPYGNCGRVLGPHDIVGTTFYIACNMMLAFTLFFFVQVGVVPKQWKTSVSVAGLVTGVAWYNYTFMKDQWVTTQASPTQYRYTDWLITVPLQITEFYFILKSSGSPVPGSLGTKLFLTSIAMVFFGWLAEINVMAKLVGFVLGCACWLYIVYETYAGQASQHAAKLTSAASRSAFNTLKVIVFLGWSIYPIGFAIAYLCFFDQPAGVLSGLAMAALNITYNLADLVNKGAFGLCVWSAAVSDKSGLEEPLMS